MTRHGTTVGALEYLTLANMKMNYGKLPGWSRGLQLGLAVAALALVGGLPTQARAQGASPTGVTWDCVMSGSRLGIAYLTFVKNPDGSRAFSGYEIIVPKSKSKEIVIGRDGEDVGRTGTPGGGETNTTSGTHIFGAEETSGPWGYDERGRVIGHFVEIADLVLVTNQVSQTKTLTASDTPAVPTMTHVTDTVCATFPVGTNTTSGVIFTNQTICVSEGNVLTNYTFVSDFPKTETNILETVCVTSVATTNVEGGILINYSNLTVCTDYEITTTALTNSLSFVAKVVPGSRLTLVCSTPTGKVTYRGVPTQTLRNISGDWNGFKKDKTQQYVEFLSLFKLVDSDIPNLYDVVGTGPGYNYQGHALLSSQKKFALVARIVPSLDLRAVIGSFNFNSLKSKTSGWEQPSGILDNHIRFQVVKASM